ncbi:MAG TPA: Rieske (2Fe-2S) protein [Ktedonobacterales bacterium]|jgi:Rieske Fe-S protein
MAEKISRRKLFIAGNAAIQGTLALLVGVPLAGYLVGAIFAPQPNAWVKVGPIGAVPPNSPTLFPIDVPIVGSGISTTRPVGVYVLKTGNQLFTFYNACTHMGCPVHWQDYAQLYKCPCHGGVYDRLGRVVSGPPPYALRQFRNKMVNTDLYVYVEVLD